MASHLAKQPLELLKATPIEPLPLVVSLTSIPSRLQTLHLTIRSLLCQSSPAHKIVLWLHHDLAKQLPQNLVILQSEVFEIRYVGLTCSHRKLIHSLEAFPDIVVVTCDDDMMYDTHWLCSLYKEHLNNPKHIVANDCRMIMRDNLGNLLPYKQWLHPTPNQIIHWPLLPIGHAGVLYPPHTLDPQVGNVELFMQLAPKADDLWFRAMAWLKGTPIIPTAQPYPKATPIIGANKVSLLKSNMQEDGNRLQWQALCNHFGLFDKG